MLHPSGSNYRTRTSRFLTVRCADRRVARGEQGSARSATPGETRAESQSLGTHATANLGSAEETSSCHGDQAPRCDRTQRT